MARQFASSTEQEIEKLLKQKDSENKRRLTKIAKELFHWAFICTLGFTLKERLKQPRKGPFVKCQLLKVIWLVCLTPYNGMDR